MAQWKEYTYNERDAGNVGLIPESGRSPAGGHDNPLQVFFAWRIMWTEEPGRLQYIKSQNVRHD